jgi:hypothetical protein
VRQVQVSIASLLVTVACAGNPRPPGSEADAAPARADATLAEETAADAGLSAGEFAARYCALAGSCCTDVAQCRAGLAAMSPYREDGARECLTVLGAAAARPGLCTDGFASVAQTCQRAFATKIATQRLGQPCAQTEDCLLSPQGPVRCAGEGTGPCQVILPGTAGAGPCVATSSGPVTVPGGDPTSTSIMGYLCSVAGGLWCDDVSGKCTASKPAGAPCTSFGECGPAGSCDDVSGKCVARKREGDPCTVDEECPSTVCGEDNKCAPPPKVDGALMQLCTRP